MKYTVMWFDYDKEVEKAFDSVKKKTVVNCIRHAT